MATYSGILTSSPKAQDLSDRAFLSANVRTPDDATFDPSAFVTGSPDTGRHYVFSTEGTTHTYLSDHQESVNAPFYTGVYFQQTGGIINNESLDFGLITDHGTFDMQIWVSFSSPSEVASIGILDGSVGVSVDNLSVGDTFGAYEEKTITFNVDGDGSAVVDTLFYITFVGDATMYSRGITGSRISRFYPLTPNWAYGVSVEKRYLTSIFTGADMSESRKVLRSRPIRNITATVLHHGKQEAGAALALMAGVAKNSSVLPWWPDRSSLTAAQDGLRIYCDVADRRFAEGGYVFLSERGGAFEDLSSDIAQISTLYSDGFDLANTIAGDYGVGDVVYPCYVANAVLGGMDDTLMSEDTGTFELSATEEYSSYTLEGGGDSYTPTVTNGLPLLTLETTFTEEPAISYLMGGVSEDSGRGFFVSPVGSPYASLTLTAVAFSRSDSKESENFFDYINGRGRPFWAVNPVNFLDLVGYDTNTRFHVGNAISQDDTDHLRYCKITDSDGNYDILAVESVVDNGSGLTITVEANSLLDVADVRHAMAVRLSEDVVTMDYLTEGRSLTTFTVMELQGV